MNKFKIDSKPTRSFDAFISQYGYKLNMVKHILNYLDTFHAIHELFNGTLIPADDIHNYQKDWISQCASFDETPEKGFLKEYWVPLTKTLDYFVDIKVAYDIEFFEFCFNKSNFHRKVKIKDEVVSYTYGYGTEIVNILGWNGIIDLFEICTPHNVDTLEPYTLEQWNKMIPDAKEAIYEIAVDFKPQVNEKHIVTKYDLHDEECSWFVITADRTNKYWMLLEYFNDEPEKQGFECVDWIPKENLKIHFAKERLLAAWIINLMFDPVSVIKIDNKNLTTSSVFSELQFDFEEYIITADGMKRVVDRAIRACKEGIIEKKEA